MQEQVQDFLEYLEVERGYSQNTLAAYRNDLSQFVSYLEQLDPSQRPRGWGNVTRDHVVGYLLDLREREYATSTVARKVAAVKSFFGYLYEHGDIRRDPTAELDSPKVEKHLPTTLTHEDVEKLLNAPSGNSATSQRDRALLEMLYATGLRVSELVALDLQDLDVREGVVRCLGKGNKERVLPVYDRALATVSVYINNGRPKLVHDSEEKALFLNRRGERLTRQGLWLIIKRYVEETGIDSEVTPHTLRHSFATHMLRGGAGLREVQQMLGHANITTTQIYTQVTKDHLREVYDESHPRA